MKNIEKICEACSRKFLVWPCHSKQRNCSRKCLILWRESRKIKKTCSVCSKEFVKCFSRKKTFCSKKCSNAWRTQAQSGKGNPNWNGGRTKEIRSGYINVLVEKGVYKREHRIIMEKYLGRKLSRFELVHHRNGIKDDNRLENLQIVTHTTHFGQIICPNCNYSIMVK